MLKLIGLSLTVFFSMQAFAVHNCQVVVSSISATADVGYGETINYFSKNVIVPDKEVGDDAMLVDLVNDKNPKLKLGQAVLWLGKTFDEGEMNDIIDATAKVTVKGQTAEMNLMMSLDATFATSMSKITIQEGKNYTYYHCNLTCHK